MVAPDAVHNKYMNLFRLYIAVWYNYADKVYFIKFILGKVEIMRQTIIEAKRESITEGVKFIEESLANLGISKKTIIKQVLVSEEILLRMIQQSPSENVGIKISVLGFKFRAKILISCKGDRIELNGMSSLNDYGDISDMDDEQLALVSNMLMLSTFPNLSLRYLGGVNRALIDCKNKDNQGPNSMLIAMVLGILSGLFLRLVIPETIGVILSENVFTFVSEVFINSIKMLVAPLVFFSIAESMTGFSDYGAFGRISSKVIGLYFFTTIIAIGVGFGLYYLFSPGNPNLIGDVMGATSGSVETLVPALSIRDMLIDIIPTNFFNAFASGQMLQLIFLAVFVGIASGLIGDKSEGVRNFITSANALFSKMTSIVVACMPVVIFCIICNLALTVDVTSIISLGKLFFTIIAGIASMIVFYGLFLLLVARINPLRFFKKYKDAAVTAFSTASSNATIPVSMRTLDKMGVSPKVYMFSIPLGSTINMDGASIYFVIITLFMLHVFDIPMTGSLLIDLIISVLLLSIGSPGIPGAAIACTALLFAQVGIPMEAIGYTVVLCTLTDFFITLSNTMGDSVVTTIVAKSEKMFDMNKFNN